jgi:hypothetical protein
MENRSMKEMHYDDCALEIPTQVKVAVILICISLAIGAIDFVLGSYLVYAQLPTTGASPIILIALVYTVAMIVKRKNWARIVFLALFAIQLPCAIPGILQGFASSLLTGTAGVTQTILRAISVTLLFQGRSNTWFRYNETAAEKELVLSRNPMEILGLYSVVTGWLAWVAFFLAIYLIQEAWFPVSLLPMFAEIERKVNLSLWLEFVIPSLLAIMACFSGIVATIKRRQTKRNSVLGIIGTVAGGGYLVVSCGLLCLAISID